MHRVWFAIVFGIVIDMIATYFRHDTIRLFIKEANVYSTGMSVVVTTAIISGSMVLIAGKENLRLAWNRVSEIQKAGMHRGYIRMLLMAVLFYTLSGAIAGNLKEYMAREHVGYSDTAKPFESTVSVASGESGLVQKKIFKAAFSAVNEEILFRLCLLSFLLLVIKSEAWALAISAFVFGLVHAVYPLSNGETLGYAFLQVFPAAIGGIFLGWAYLQIGLVTALFFHFLQDIAYQFASLRSFSRPLVLALVALSLLCIVVETFMFLKNRKHA